MKTRCHLTYGLEDVTAAKDATLSVTDKQSFVSLSQLHEEDALLPYATLEGDGFALDGTRVLFPNAPASAHMGLWSGTLSGATGTFSTYPTLTVSFTQPHTSGGLTFLFSEETDEFATDMDIYWLNASGAQVDYTRFYPTGANACCVHRVEDYYGLRIRFRALNKPYHFLKLSRLIYGFICDFESGTDRLVSASVSSALDLTADTVPVSELNFSFLSTDDSFDLLSPSGAHILFQQQQWVKVEETVGDDTYSIGKFYLETPKTRGGVTQMRCIDLLGVLDKTDFAGGMWKTAVTAKTLALAILESAGLSAEDLVMDSTLAARTVSGYLPICTHREALQQLAFALAALVHCDGEGNIALHPPAGDVAHTILPRDKAQGHTVSQNARVTGVEVYTHSYAQSDDTRTLFEETLAVGTHTVCFSAPAASVAVTGATLTASDVNQAIVKVTSAGTVTIKGKPYVDSTVLAGSCYATSLPANAKANVISVSGCTLTADAQALAEALYARQQYRLVDSGTFFPIAARLSDAVCVTGQTGQSLSGFVTGWDADLTGGFLISGEVTGAYGTEL